MSDIKFDDLDRKYADTFRLSYDRREAGDIMMIDFGEFNGGQDVDVKASVDLPIELMRDFVYKAIAVIKAYDDTTGRNILGLPK